MMKIRGWYLIVISLGFGLVAAWLANQWLGNKAQLVEAKNADINIAVAATEIPYGTTIESKHVNLIKIRKGTELGGYFTAADQVIGKVAKQKLLSGEILLKEKFTVPGEGSTLAALIRPQMRAVTVRVDDVVGVAGFLLPGNHVDVMAARIVQERAISRTILSNLNVLAVDQTTGADKNKPVVVRAVTLEVSPQQAETLMRAREEGRIQLTLRNPNDLSVLPEPIEVEKANEKKIDQQVVAAPVVTSRRVRAVTPAVQVKTEPEVTVIRGTYVNGMPSK